MHVQMWANVLTLSSPRSLCCVVVQLVVAAGVVTSRTCRGVVVLMARGCFDLFNSPMHRKYSLKPVHHGWLTRVTLGSFVGFWSYTAP